MNTVRKLWSNKRGSSLILVMLLFVIVSAIGAGLLQLGLCGRIRAIRTAQEIQARSAADAGLIKAIIEMNQRLRARSWDAVALRYTFSDTALPGALHEPLPHCEATFSYDVTLSSTKTYNEFPVTCLGNAGPTVKAVHATIAVKSIFDSAILVRDRISLASNTLLSGYNSADPTDTDADLKIGTTSTLADRITLGPGTVVNGDIFVGVDGDPGSGVGAGGTVNGLKYALLDEPPFPVITAPPLPNKGTSLSAAGTTLTIGPGDTGKYTNISLTKGTYDGILEVTGGDVVLHITGDIDLGQSCEIIVRPGSSLTIYVDGNVNLDNSMGINNQAGHVKDFSLYATGTNQVFNLKAKSSIFGTVYAPNVDITLYPGAEIHGALVGNTVTVKSGAQFYYDEALRDVTVFQEGVYFVVKRWREE